MANICVLFGCVLSSDIDQNICASRVVSYVFCYIVNSAYVTLWNRK